MQASVPMLRHFMTEAPCGTSHDFFIEIVTTITPRPENVYVGNVGKMTGRWMGVAFVTS
jgi:hypothetical protein